MNKHSRFKPELNLLLFFIVYSIFLILLSSFYSQISCTENGCTYSITNWYLLSLLVVIGVLRIIWYGYRKIRFRSREEEQEQIEQKISDTQDAFNEKKNRNK